MMENILVVDDEREIADLIELYLTNESYAVIKCYMGLDAGYHSAWIGHLLEQKGIQGVIGYRRHTQDKQLRKVSIQI